MVISGVPCDGVQEGHRGQSGSGAVTVARLPAWATVGLPIPVERPETE